MEICGTPSNRMTVLVCVDLFACQITVRWCEFICYCRNSISVLCHPMKVLYHYRDPIRKSVVLFLVDVARVN